MRAVVDVTAGQTAASGSALAVRHRYLAGENTTASVTITSDTAVLSVEGYYSVASGSGVDYNALADALFEMGLFQGSGTAYGSGYDLEVPSTRIMGVVMFLRLIGEEQAALSSTAANPFAMQEIADALRGHDIPVLVKNPVNPDLELWIGAIERLYNAGLRRLGAIHRGFSSYDRTIYRNQPQWHIPIELRRRLPQLPLLCDPSHIGGKRELIAPLSQEAMDLGFDGLIVESHCTPDEAWSDKQQQVTPDVLCFMLHTLVVRETTQTTEPLAELRQQIDRLDDELLALMAKRMRISREIGQYKKEHSMPILQAKRYDEILNKRGAQAVELGINPEFVKTLLQAIHEESVHEQVKVING